MELKIPLLPKRSKLSPLQLIGDEGLQRSDLKQRTELKFNLPGSDLEKLRRILEVRFQRQIHSQTVSTVRSLYFDTPHFSACRANIDGLASRRKIRIRWYDRLQPERDFFFEVKWRENRVTGKHRLQYHSTVPLHELHFDEMKSGLMATLPEAYRANFLQGYEPVVIVEYQREHFVSPDEKIRLTLDYNLKFYDQVARRSWQFRFPTALENFVLIECKMPVGLEPLVAPLLSPLRLRVGRCSKYVHGCQQLGYAMP